jgi:hypothetical protein
MGDGPAPAAAGGSRSAVAAGFTVLFVTTGVNFTFGILFKPILLDLGSDSSTLALATTASLTVNALGQPLFGGADRSTRPAPGHPALDGAHGRGHRAGRPSRPDLAAHPALRRGGRRRVHGRRRLPVSVHAGRWFPAERGFVMAVAACGLSLGQLVFTQLAAHLHAAVGWRRTYGLLAAILAAFLAIIAVWLREAPRPPGVFSGPAPGAGGEPGRRAAMATPAFWALTAGLMGCGFTDFLITTHLAAFATDLGLSR